MNETDRTIVGLLFHENIIDYIPKKSLKNNIELYLKILENICFADYIDRITFQKQIWQFNEMSSLIKVFYNNKLFHDNIKNNDNQINPKKINIRFTKILTKYSTEYNNQIFIQLLCQELNMDIKDMYLFFTELKNNKNLEKEINQILDTVEITHLDINRITRYIERYNKKINTFSKTNESNYIFDDDIVFENL